MEKTALDPINRGTSFLIILILAFSLCVTIILDLNIARQVLGFVFLTFAPGLMLLQFLGVERTSKLELILFSVGLSIAFLLISGFVINQIGYFLFPRPLSTLPLILVTVGFTVICGFISYLKKKEVPLFSFGSVKDGLIHLLPFGFVVLSIIGTFFVTVYHSNLFLLLMLAFIPILFAMLFLSRKADSSGFPVIVIFVIALCMLLHTSLISQYIQPLGSDAPVEYSVFKSTQSNNLWSADSNGNLYYTRLGSMLSVTILPVVYSSILNMDSTFLFKILYPVLFAFVPVILYSVWQQFFGKKYALAASFLFITQATFFTEMLGLGRQIVAELFFALLILVIFNKGLKTRSKMTLFLVFSFGLVVSHYALAIIFIGFILIAFIFRQINKRITYFYLISSIAMLFSWYILVGGSAVFNSILTNLNYIISQANNFLDPAARGDTILLGLGFGASPSIWNTISRIFAYGTELLILIGILVILLKKNRLRLDWDYLIITVFGVALLAALIVVPGLADTLNMTRFYHILLFVLAPLFIMGIDFVAGLIPKHKKLVVSILTITILIPYFLFQTSFVYEVTGAESWSISISQDSMPPQRLYGQLTYVDTGSFYSADWVSKNVNVLNYTLYADVHPKFNVLTLYGVSNNEVIQTITNTTIISRGGTVYLGSFNVEERMIQSSWDFADLRFQMNSLNKLYDNGRSQILQNQP